MGFRAGTIPLAFYPAEREVREPLPMNLSLILLDRETDVFSGLFTRNAFPGFPVIIGRERLERPSTRGVLINNKIANVRAPGGKEAAEQVLEALAACVGCDPESFFPSSTGIIGWRLPAAEMRAAMPALLANLSSRSILPVAQGIMTTDSFPKVRSTPVGAGRLVGIAKGAGMIEPNCATMLVYLLTDVTVDRDPFRGVLREACEDSFNRISVDGDQSTSDTVLGFSSCLKPRVGVSELRDAFRSVCGSLAEDIVRNGEGTRHVIRAMVDGARTEEEAVGVARRIVNSPLVKTAVFGNDPNVGRLVMAVGNWFGSRGESLDPEAVAMAIGGSEVYARGRFVIDKTLEERLSAYLADRAIDPGTDRFPRHERTVDIRISLGRGGACAQVLGSDLSYDYVKENADYRS